jgi:hypothetical protein
MVYGSYNELVFMDIFMGLTNTSLGTILLVFSWILLITWGPMAMGQHGHC